MRDILSAAQGGAELVGVATPTFASAWVGSRLLQLPDVQRLQLQADDRQKISETAADSVEVRGMVQRWHTAP